MKEYLYPKAGSIRGPTETQKEHGQIVNPPRMAEMGGLNKLKERNGAFKNSMTIKKPGSSR